MKNFLKQVFNSDSFKILAWFFGINAIIVIVLLEYEYFEYKRYDENSAINNAIIAKEVNKPKSQENLNEIYFMIKVAAKNGKYFTEVKHILIDNSIIKQLKSLKYTIVKSNDGYNYTISWNNIL